MIPCLFGQFRPVLALFSFVEEKKEKTDNYYTCVALRAAGKNAITNVLFPFNDISAIYQGILLHNGSF